MGRRSCSSCSSGGRHGRAGGGAVYAEPIVSGANGAALALIAAWSIPDLQAARRGSYYEGELLGAGAIAATLLLLPYARPEASWLAGVVGGVVGLILGLGLQLIDRPELYVCDRSATRRRAVRTVDPTPQTRSRRCSTRSHPRHRSRANRLWTSVT